MRLIDADALPVVARGKNHHRRYVFADITDAPAVDAIPVEWIYAQMERFDDSGDPANGDLLSWLIGEWQMGKETTP